MGKSSWIFGLIVIIIIGVLFFFVVSDDKDEFPSDSVKDENSCVYDSDCIKDSCCHASSCVAAENAPECLGVVCSQECVPGTLDCGQGSCKCVNNKCGVSLDE
ncbi:MAG TPA: hypothetical protein VI544_01380 [Candidatus Nanoarchaeia archaeon]|nr:hypothetical protein [Candidatus Nanoarchaeia archaeon]